MTIKKFILDTGPLGMVTHPNAESKHKELLHRIKFALSRGCLVYIPAISDYELRRNYILEGFTESIKKLDSLISTLNYLPIDKSCWHRACELWATIRKSRTPTADNKALDGDVILAAQTAGIEGIVVTDNIKHLSLMVETIRWKDLEK